MMEKKQQNPNLRCCRGPGRMFQILTIEAKKGDGLAVCLIWQGNRVHADWAVTSVIDESNLTFDDQEDGEAG